MTVEAAYIVPFVVLLLTMLVSLSFLQYDRCAALQECCVRAYRESIRRGGETADSEGREKWVSYFALQEWEITCTLENKAVAAAKGRVSTPVSFGGWTETADPFQFSCEVKARKTDPPQAFRRCRRSLAVLEAAAGKEK